MGEPTTAPDVELLRRIAGGDSEALGAFYDQHASLLLALAFRILHDLREAEDVLQDTLLQVWERAVAYDPTQGRPLAWVLTLTRNKAIDRLRSAQRRARLVEEASADLLTEDDPPSRSLRAGGSADDEAELVRAALARLPAEQRQAIEMAFFGGLSQSEIAAALNEPLGTVKARIRRGMRKLREELEPHL